MSKPLIKKAKENMVKNDKVWPMLGIFWFSFGGILFLFFGLFLRIFLYLWPILKLGVVEWIKYDTGVIRTVYEDWLYYSYVQIKMYLEMNDLFLEEVLIAIGIFYIVHLFYDIYSFFEKETELCMNEFNSDDLEKGNAKLHKEVKDLAKQFEFKFEPEIYIYKVAEPNIYMFGRNHAESTIVVTQGLIDLLTKEELMFVLAQKIDESHDTEHLRSLLSALSLLDKNLENMLLKGIRFMYRAFRSWIAIACIGGIYLYMIVSWWMMIDSTSMLEQTTKFVDKYSCFGWFAVETLLALSLVGMSLYLIKLLIRFIHLVYRVAYWITKVIYHHNMKVEVYNADLKAYELMKSNKKQFDVKKVFDKIVNYYMENQYLQKRSPLNHLAFINPNLVMNGALAGTRPSVERRISNIEKKGMKD